MSICPAVKRWQWVPPTFWTPFDLVPPPTFLLGPGGAADTANFNLGVTPANRYTGHRRSTAARRKRSLQRAFPPTTACCFRPLPRHAETETEFHQRYYGSFHRPIMPKRLQQKRTKGWRKPKNAVVVSRPMGRWRRLRPRIAGRLIFLRQRHRRFDRSGDHRQLGHPVRKKRK